MAYSVNGNPCRTHDTSRSTHVVRCTFGISVWIIAAPPFCLRCWLIALSLVNCSIVGCRLLHSMNVLHVFFSLSLSFSLFASLMIVCKSHENPWIFHKSQFSTRPYLFEHKLNAKLLWLAKHPESDQVILTLAMSWHEKYDYFVDCSHLVAFSLSLLHSFNYTLAYSIFLYNYI